MVKRRCLAKLFGKIRLLFVVHKQRALECDYPRLNIWYFVLCRHHRIRIVVEFEMTHSPCTLKSFRHVMFEFGLLRAYMLCNCAIIVAHASAHIHLISEVTNRMSCYVQFQIDRCFDFAANE